jgi:hypothetical protein
MSDDIQFMNMDTYRGGGGGKNTLSFKQILLLHVKKCVDNGSLEFHGGYWIEKSAGTYTIEKTYVQNSREVFCNSVRMLRCLLLGYFDEKMKLVDEPIMLKLAEINKVYEDTKLTSKDAKNIYNEKRISEFITLLEELLLLLKRENFLEEEVVEEIM